MAFLSDITLRERLNNQSLPLDERIEIQPMPAGVQLGPCSIDLTLSTEFARFRRFPFLSLRRTFDPRSNESVKQAQDRWYKYYSVTAEKGFLIRRNEVVLGMTRESIRLPKTTLGLITGRSSYSRMGIEVQQTQDLRQPGHSGQIQLQIKNNAPFSFRLYPGMRIAQLLVASLDTACSIGYDEVPDSKYKGEKGGISAKWFCDKDLENRQIISRQTYLKPLLDALLITFAVLSLALGFRSAQVNDPVFLAVLSLMIVIAVVRLAVFFSE